MENEKRQMENDNCSHHDDDRHYHRSRSRLLLNKALQLHAHMLFQQCLIRQSLPRRTDDGRSDNLLRIAHQRVRRSTAVAKTIRAQSANAARNDARLALQFASLFVDRQNNGDRSFVRQLLSFAHSLTVDLFKSTLVDERAPDLLLVTDGRPLAVEFEHVAVFDQDDVLFRVAKVVFYKLLVPKQHAI